MTRIAAYVVLILLAFMFAASTPLWQVPVRTGGGNYESVIRLLESRDERYPSEPTMFDAGYRISMTACDDCHGIIDRAEPYPISPREIYDHITFGHSTNPDIEEPPVGFASGKDHPAFPSALIDSDRWAISNWYSSIGLLDYLDFEDQSGAELFSTFCTDCHGPMGYGNGPLSKDLSPPPTNLRDLGWLAGKSNLDLYEAVATGAGEPDTSGMPAWNRILDHEQIMELVAFIRYFGLSMEQAPDVSNWPEIEGPDSNLWTWDEIKLRFPDTSGEPPDYLN